MKEFRPVSTIEQLAGHLREEILRGGLGDALPGVNQLAGALGVGSKTVNAAVRLLERDGMLQMQGPRRRSRILSSESGSVKRHLRVAILHYEPTSVREGYMLELQHLLEAGGHTAVFAEKSLVEMRMDVRRVVRLAAATEADAWIIHSGSREVLEWFAAQPVPAFALFGRRQNMPLAGAGPDHPPAARAATRRLIELGHRRIVMLVRPDRRASGPGSSERAVLEEMEAHGIKTGSYNLPDWENSREDFHRVLDNLYRVSPPSALILHEALLFFAAQQHLAQQGILAPQHVSLICTAPEPIFAWAQPSIAHVRYDLNPVLRRVVRWADNVSCGRNDHRQSLIKAEFVEGGTVGPAKDG